MGGYLFTRYRRAVSLLFTCFLMIGTARAGGEEKPFVRSADGITLYPDARVSGGVKAVRLQVVRGNIIRVTASPEKTFADPKSLTTSFSPEKVKWSLEEKGETLELKAPGIIARVTKIRARYPLPMLPASRSSRSVIGAAGPWRRLSLRGSVPGASGRRSSPGRTMASLAWGNTRKAFTITGAAGFLWQNNTEVAVPFLLGARNYGVLWENYSYTLAGDAREMMPLSRLRLFDKDGKEGWLTASYSKDHRQPETVAFTKAESFIDYNWLEDTDKNISKSFPLQDGAITWKGISRPGSRVSILSGWCTAGT